MLAYHMGINLGGFYIKMPQQFLHGSYITARAQQLGCKTMPEGMAGNAFMGKPAFSHRALKRFTRYRIVQVMPAQYVSNRVAA